LAIIIFVLLLSLLFLLLYHFWFRSNIQKQQQELSRINSLFEFEQRSLQENLLKSEDQLILILKNLPIAVFIQVDGRFKMLNNVLCEFLGIDNEMELLDTLILNSVHPQFHEEVKKRIHYLNDRKLALSYPLISKFFRKDGTEIWCETTAIPIVFKGVNGALVFLKNISEKRNMEIERKNAESFSAAILDSLSASICVLNEDGLITSVNRNWIAFAECENGDTRTKIGVGMNYLEVCEKAAASGETLAQKVYTGIREVLDGNLSSFNLEYPCHSSTEKRWFVMNVVPLQKDQLGVVISHQNTTDIKLSELDRMEIQRRFVNAFEHAPIGMAVVSLDGEMIKVNPSFCFLLGYQRDDLLKKSIGDISFEEEYAEELLLIKRMKRQELANSEMDRKFICKSGDIIMCRLILSMVLDEQEEPSYFIYQFLDITENVKYLNSIEEQNKVLKEITWMQSHVVRAPLARLMALINALEEAEESEFPHQKLREEVQNSAHELDEIIREISNKAQRVNDLQ
jgi:PAS domain S-box-containing protein